MNAAEVGPPAAGRADRAPGARPGAVEDGSKRELRLICSNWIGYQAASEGSDRIPFVLENSSRHSRLAASSINYHSRMQRNPHVPTNVSGTRVTEATEWPQL